MMCSNWKISMFGILALILAFGLVTTDALAQGPPNTTISVVSTEPRNQRVACRETKPH